VYETDKYHFDLQLFDRILFLRHRRFGASGRWFVNMVFAAGRKVSLTSTQICETDVMQILVFYLYAERLRPEPDFPANQE